MPAEELQAVVEMLAASAAGGEGLGTGLDTRLGAVLPQHTVPFSTHSLLLRHTCTLPRHTLSCQQTLVCFLDTLDCFLDTPV